MELTIAFLNVEARLCRYTHGDREPNCWEIITYDDGFDWLGVILLGVSHRNFYTRRLREDEDFTKVYEILKLWTVVEGSVSLPDFLSGIDVRYERVSELQQLARYRNVL